MTIPISVESGLDLSLCGAVRAPLYQPAPEIDTPGSWFLRSCMVDPVCDAAHRAQLGFPLNVVFIWGFDWRGHARSLQVFFRIFPGVFPRLLVNWEMDVFCAGAANYQVPSARSCHLITILTGAMHDVTRGRLAFSPTRPWPISTSIQAISRQIA